MESWTRWMCVMLAASTVMLSGCARRAFETPTETTEVRETAAQTTAVTEVQEIAEKIDSVPLFFQTDYPDIAYGSGTVATSGCGVAALAMVASYMTDHWYYPDELAYYFGGRAENNIQRLEYGCEVMQIPYQKANDWNDVAKALRDGDVAIVMLNENSAFTDSQHFIVLRGMTEEDKVLVNDPYEPNYSVWELKYGYDNGFAESQIIAGYSGGWIFDTDAMPEEPFLYEQMLPSYIKRGVSRRETDTQRRDYDADATQRTVMELAPDELDLLAGLVWTVAREEPADCQQAIAEVVLNRLASGRFPNTIQGVLGDQSQFPATEELQKATPTQAQYAAVESAMEGPFLLATDVVFYTKTDGTQEAALGEIGGFRFSSE